MKALLVDNSGDNPVMVIGEHPDPVPADKELLVKIEATALNRADLLQKAGKYPPPVGESPILGLEMAGVVESVGEGVSKFQKGDAVFGLLGGGGYAEYCTIHEDLAMPMLESLSFEEAAAIPEVFLTAFQAVIWLAELDEGETILIHAGASGVGTAAIQLADQLKNARIVVTAGSDEKLQLCRSLGARLLINYKRQNHSDIIEAELGKNSVNVIIDFVGSPYWHDNLKVMAMDSRLVYLAMLGGAKVEKMSIVPILSKRLTIKGSTLRNRNTAYKARLTKEFYSNTINLFKNVKLRPIIDSVYDWRDVEKAHSRMENNQNAGKIVLNGM
ncbi:MAG: NAD(P)H-quinone oxidoreductase [Balneolaceae bacterium]|nr:MAG: NAD(P)H-quinone oxidoreductase [Balneolaceae bacterium]